jgi:hypothetical protein
MRFLQHLLVRPNAEALTAADARFVRSAFQTEADGVRVYADVIRWTELEEIEVVKAPRAVGPAGWLVRHLVHGEERYHVGLYYGGRESVLPNVTEGVARYMVQCVAFYAPLPVRYQGAEAFAPLT